LDGVRSVARRAGRGRPARQGTGADAGEGSGRRWPAFGAGRRGDRGAGPRTESLAAYRAAKRNRLQTSLNLALGSALATIGLTIPSVAVVSLMLDLPLSLASTPRASRCSLCR